MILVDLWLYLCRPRVELSVTEVVESLSLQVSWGNIDFIRQERQELSISHRVEFVKLTN